MSAWLSLESVLLGCPGGPAWGFLPFPRGTSPHPPGVPDIHPLSGELCVYHIHYLRAGLLKGDGASVLIPGLGLAPPLGRHFCISSRLQKAPQMGALMFPRARVLTEVVVRWQPHLLGFLKLNLTFFLLHSTSDVHKLLGALWAWLRAAVMCRPETGSSCFSRPKGLAAPEDRAWLSLLYFLGQFPQTKLCSLN